MTKVKKLASEEARDCSGKRNRRGHPRPSPETAARAATPTRKCMEPQGERPHKAQTRPLGAPPRNMHGAAARTQRAWRFHLARAIWAQKPAPHRKKTHPQERCAKRTAQHGPKHDFCTKYLCPTLIHANPRTDLH